MRQIWTTLIIPPFLFLFVIIAASIYFGATLGVDGQAIADNVTQSTPYILLITQILMLLLFIWALKSSRLTLSDMGWQIGAGQVLWQEILIGVVVGVVLVGLYFYFLSPMMIAAQHRFGDYVPPGELFSVLGTAVFPFFLANVLLAPFVEENIYRGMALTGLTPKYGIWGAILISCIFFGLLHWSGGFWYMLLTGIVAGGSFAALFVWRGQTVTPFVAHLLLNGIEFLVIWLRVSGQ